MSPRKRSLREKFGSLYLWHRYAGLIAALLVIWLSVTGIALNHADDLNLRTMWVEQRWLLGLYNIRAPQDIAGRQVAGHWISTSGERIYVNDVFAARGQLAGMATTDFGFVIGLRDRVQLYTGDGVLVEEVPFTATPAPLDALAEHPMGVVLIAGNETFLADSEFLTFRKIDTDMSLPVRQLEPLPASLAEKISNDVLFHSLHWERVLLDLHAGRVFGHAGKWIMDIAAGLLLLLAASGIIIWLQRAQARRRHHRRSHD